MKFLDSIFKFLAKRKSLLLTVALVSVMLLPSAAFAEPSVEKTAEQTVASLLAIFMRMLNTFLWPFLLLIGELMDNDMITGPGMEDRLKLIWSQVRDLVNIAFVIYLLVVAFYNVSGMGGGEGNLAMKTALPKLVLGLVMVNFTFLGGKLLLDLSSVATTAAFGLVQVTESEGYTFEDTANSFAANVCLKNKDGGNADSNLYHDTEGSTDKIPPQTRIFCKQVDGIYTGELDELMEASYFQDLNVSNVALVMAVNMGALDSLQLLKEEGVLTFQDLVINSGFSVLMYVIFAISYIVLAIVLIARIVVLWAVMAFSPVAVLFYVIPELKEAAGGAGDASDKVMKHVLAPVIIGVTLSIGYIMITTMEQAGNSFEIFTNFKSGDIFNKEFLLAGVNDMEKFLVAIVSVVVVWTGVFAAAEGSVAQFATDWIKGFGENVGGFIAKAPLYLPVLPTASGSGDKNMAPIALLQASQALMGSFRETGFDSANPISEQVYKLTGGKGGLYAASSAAPRRDFKTNSEALSLYLGQMNTSNFEHIKAIAAQVVLKNQNLSQGDKEKYSKQFEAAKDYSSFQTVLKEIAGFNGHAENSKKDILGMTGEELGKKLPGYGDAVPTTEAAAHRVPPFTETDANGAKVDGSAIRAIQGAAGNGATPDFDTEINALITAMKAFDQTSNATTQQDLQAAITAVRRRATATNANGVDRQNYSAIKSTIDQVERKANEPPPTP
jgi:hypothetical protein